MSPAEGGACVHVGERHVNVRNQEICCVSSEGRVAGAEAQQNTAPEPVGPLLSAGTGLSSYE